MTKYVDFPLEKNEMIRVEVETGGVSRGGTQAVVESATIAFEQALGKLKPMCAAIVRQVRDAAEQPEEIEVEFGIKLSAEAGFILTSASGEANLKISVTWKRKIRRLRRHRAG